MLKLKMSIGQQVFEFEGSPADGAVIFPLAEKWLTLIAECGSADNAELHAAIEKLEKERVAQAAAVAAQPK